MKLHSYLLKSRHNIYYLRIQRNGVDKRISLRTQDLKTATLAAYRIGAKLAAMSNKEDKIRAATPDELAAIAETEAQNRAWDRVEAILAKKREDALFEHYLSELNLKNPLSSTEELVSEKTPETTTAGLKKTCLRDALKEYEKILAKSKQAEKSKKMALSTLNDLTAKLGADFDMSLLDDEAIENGWLEPRLKEVAATTAKRDLSFIRAFVAWSADKKRMYSPTPLNLTLDAKGEHWKYLNSTDLKALFSNLPEHSDKPWHLWIPILGLYTGGRISELASLQTSYFFEKSGLNVMHLAGTKTDASPRDLPIHPDLIALGLLNYVTTRRNSGNEMLFDITRSEQNGWGAAATKWFSAYKKTCGVTDDLKVFHSFRHTIIDLMNQISVSHKAQCQYTGHSSASDVHSKVYGRGALSLQVMQDEVVSKIDFKQYCGWHLDIENLKKKLILFYKPLEYLQFNNIIYYINQQFNYAGLAIQLAV